MTENGTLSGKRLTFVQALATMSIEGAGRAAGISERTARRWVKDPQIIAALNETEAQTMQALSRRLIGLGEKAARVINESLESQDGDAVKLRAAGMALDKLLQMRELVTLEQRLAALEAEVGKGKTQ